LTCHLLDVNVLLALQWPGEISHRRIQDWFFKTGMHSFSTCSMTQSGFVRVIANPSYAGKRLDVSEARESLFLLTELDGHQFWPMDLEFKEATDFFSERLVGHLQVTDAYLLGLAIHKQGILVTQDRAIAHLAGSKYREYVMLL
jgi:toxin-antitoxin system PIN domain toxin